MESENAQEEDLTPNLIHQDVTKPKESSVPTDDNLLKSNYISAEKDNSSEVLFDSSAFVEQVGKVNGKVSEKEEEEEEDEEDSRNAEQLSQSSSSDDSSGSSDVSSSSSDDDVNLSSQNQWSSSVTCKGIKLSVKGIRSSDQTDDVRCESDDTSRPNRASFCDEVKSSRLSDDSSSSDSGGGSPPQSFSKPVNSNCNNSNSLEKDSLDVNQSPNSRHPNSTNFKGSISNFPSSNLSRFENSSLDQNSFNISRNDRRSTDSVGSHLSLKSNDIFERKLSLSSDSSDSENSCNQLELDSIKSSLNPSVETNLLNSVKSITSDSNNSSFKPDLFNELSDSTCVKFNSVNTTRSPEKKITSPIKENSQGYSLLDRFSNTEEKTPTESIPNTINPQQKLTPSQLSLKLSNSSSPNSSQAPSFKLSNNGEERRSNFSDSFLSNSISKGKNVGVRDEADLPSQNSLAKTGIQQLEEELSLGNEKFSSVSVSNSSDSAGFKDSGAKTEPSRISDLVEPSRPVNVKNEEALPDVLNRVNNESEHISDLDLDFQSQDMGMEISSDSSLSSDEVSEEESGSHLNDLSDLSSQSRNSDGEIVDSVSDIMGVIDGSDGKEMEKVSRETHVKEPEETMADVMKVIGSPSDKETKDPVDVMKVTGNTSDNETKDSAIDVMKVIGDASENETKYLVDDVLKVIGATSDEQVEKPLVDTLKVVDRSTRDESEESIRKVIGIGEKETEDSVFDVMKVIGVSNNLESNDTMSEVMKVIGVVNEKGVEDSTIGIKIAGGNDRQEADETMAEVMKVVGVANEKGVEDSTTGMKIAGGNDRQETDKTMADVMKIIGVSSEKETEDPTDDIAKVLDSSCSEKESDEPMEVDIMKVIGGSDFEMDESNEDLSVAKSQVTGVSSSQVSDTITKQSSLSVSGSDKTEDEVKFNSVEDTKAERSDRLSDVEKASSSGLISCNSSIVNQGNTTQTKPDSNLVNNCNEQLNSITNEDSNTEPEKAGSSDNILSIISKDLKTSNGTKSLSKTKRLLLKQKKGSIKFKKKLKLLKRLGSGYESNKSDAQVPGQEPGKPEEEPLAEYAQYLGLQPTLKFKCCICAQIGFQSYAELREHQKNCQASEAGRSSASSEKISPTKSTPCTNAEDINQTNFRITRKVYLCSACGTYYENWNLFLHMQEVHQRFICLLCLGMFTMSYKLSDHLILTHGVEVKSFQNLSDFRQAFNCALYVSCTDCGKTFSEGDNWSSHHCLFTCNVCSIKNGHLPRCPRNFFVKADETIADMKLPTKCIIRINPSSCATTTILPKRDDKCYDIASNFCSVDITEIGESSMEPSDSEKTESPSRPEKPLSIEQKSNPNTPAVCESNAEDPRIQNNNVEKESSSQQSIPCSSNVALNPDENESRSLDPSEDKEKKLETASNNSSTADEKTSSKEVISEVNDTNPSDLSGNHSNQGNESNEEETEKKSETSDLTSDSESGSEDEKPKETSSVGSCELQKAEILDKPSDMKLIIKKSALNNPMFKLNTNPSKTEKASVDLGTDAVEKIAENKQDSSVFDPDYDLQTRPAQSRSVTSPVHDESHTEPVSCNPNSIVKESFDFKNRLNPDSKTQDPSALGFNSESEIRRESEKDSSFETSIESQPSDDSRMDYESDSQPHLSGDSKAANNIQASDAEKALSQSNDTSDSDSNRLSMVVDNNDQTTNSRPSPRGSPADEKMMIDYEGDNAVDNADVGQSESNYNSFSSDQGSPLKVANFDGITLAAEDVTPLTLPLSGPLDTMALNTIVKECVRVSCTSCAYCNHALKIAVNAKELVLHLLAEHRYTPAKDEDSPVKLVSTLKNGVNSLESVFFNTDSYDSSDKSSNLSYDGTFSCFQCPFWTLQHKDLYTHKRKMHQKTILLCVMCKSNFYSYSELLCHMCPGTYQPNDILFRCCFCHIDKIPSAFRLMVHIRKIHHTCEICLDVSTDQQKLATHMWKHKLHHLCYRCGIAYRNKPDITRHLFWKHGTESVLCKKCLQKKWPHVYHFCIPPATVVCDECNATFTRTVALRVHKRLHTNEKPHACTQCEEKFISKKILAKHELSHLAKEDESAVGDVEKKENYDPTVAKNLLGITDPPVQIQKTDEKQNIDVDDETVPVIRIKKNKSKKSKPMLDLTALPPLNLSSESDSEPEPPKPAPAPETVEVKSEAEDKFEVEDKSDKPEAEDKSAPETTDLKDTLPMETEVEEKKENIVECTDSQRLEIILADHDYCKPQSEEKEISETKDTKLDTSVDLNSSLNATLDTKDASASDSSPTKRKSKSPKKKLNKSSNSSSSSSSSDTDSSSCSCGPNCSCSSSSSDSSTSTSSDSDSSNPENRRKQEERRQKRRERAKTKSPKTDPEPVISVENEEMYILESDLETDITLTDEDFYDEYPQQHANKMLAEKQESDKDQLMLLASVAPTHTAPSSPVVSAEEAPAPAPQPSSSPKLKKRLKTKRKRDETLVPASAPHGAQSILESKLTQLPPSMPSLITKLPNPNARNYTPMSQTPTSEHFSDRTLSTGGSGSESESKRSKRRRVKNKFYGYSSEEENPTESSKPRFKPKKLKKVIAVRKPEPTLTRPNPFNVSLPIQPAAMSVQQSYQPYQPTVTVKPVVPSASNVVRSTLPPVRHRPPSPFSSSDSDDDKLNIDEKYEPPQATLTPTLAAALAAPPQPNATKNTNLYCYCQCPYDEVSEMIACDGDNCRIEWFHFECVGIMVPPKGQWFCPDCRKKKNLSY